MGGPVVGEEPRRASPASRKRPWAYSAPNDTIGSVLPWTIATGTPRCSALSFESATRRAHWKITPAEIGKAPLMSSGVAGRLYVGNPP